MTPTRGWAKLARFTYDVPNSGGTAMPEPDDFLPILTAEHELAEPIADVANRPSESGRPYGRLLTLVRVHTRPIGVALIDLPGGGLSGEDVAHRIWASLDSAIIAHLAADGLPPIMCLTRHGLSPGADLPCTAARRRLLAEPPFVSVIIPTHERPELLGRCLESLLAMQYPNLEIVIVDNVPDTTRTRDLIATRYGDRGDIRYFVEERRAGSATARNRGLRVSRGELVAFTDDDVVVDRYWLAELLTGFSAGDHVGCVTGLIMPMELETPAQIWFEEYGGFGKGFERRLYDLGPNRPASPLFPYNPSMFGSGNSMAFRVDALHEVGSFDPSLGNGTPTLGGVDIEAFFRIVQGGYQLVYEPGAMIHHAHRREYEALRRQVFAYGSGLTALLTKAVARRPSLLLDLALKAPLGLWMRLAPNDSSSSVNSGLRLRRSTDYPSELVRDELNGMLYGPLAYLRSVLQTRRPRRPRRRAGPEAGR
jgi:O-antigen biosynthesis protein